MADCQIPKMSADLASTLHPFVSTLAIYVTYLFRPGQRTNIAPGPENATVATDSQFMTAANLRMSPEIPVLSCSESFSGQSWRGVSAPCTQRFHIAMKL
jgi:hypothetical protein